MENAKYLISLAERENVDAELFSLRRDLRSIRITGNEIVEAQNIVEGGIAIRVLKDDRIGFAATNNPSRDSLERSFRSALNISKTSATVRSGSDFPKRFGQKKRHFPQWLCDKELSAMPPDETAEFATRMIKEAHSDRSCKRALSAVLITLFEEFSILNSRGLEHVSEPSSLIYSRIVMETGKGDRYSTSESQFCSRKCSDFKPEEEIDKATTSGSEVLELPRKSISRGMCDVILSPESAGAFTSYLIGPMIVGNRIQAGTSCLGEKLNERIAAETYSLVDDGQKEGGIASATVDDEGTRTQSTTIVDHGTLTSFLHDTLSASSCGTISTGNARRVSDTIGRTYVSPPEPLPTNLIIGRGDYSSEELVQTTKAGIIVDSIGYTFHMVPEHGYFKIFCSVPARIIEGGEIKAYTQNIVVSDELVKALTKIDAIGKDARQSICLSSMAVLSPHLRIREMSVSPMS